MEQRRLRVAGQPIHLVLLMFPVGLFATAVLFDAGNLLGAPALLGEVAYWVLAAAITGSVLVCTAGAVEATFIRAHTAARQTRVLQGLANFGVLLLFLVILLLRTGSTERAAGWGLLLVELVALAAAVAAARLLHQQAPRALEGRQVGQRLVQDR